MNVPDLPPGRSVDLPGRGAPFVRHLPAPDGAPTLVLLHGWTVTSDLNWFTTFAALRGRYGVVSFDHRGHGRGIRPKGGRVRLADCADDVPAVLDALGVGPAVMVGYSMGGAVAQLVWRRHRERVAGLVLCSTARNFQTGPMGDLWYRGQGALGRLATLAPGPAERLLARAVDGKVDTGPHAEWARRELLGNDPAGLLSAGADIGRFRSNGWIGGVDVPTSVVVTTRDRTVPSRRQRGLAEAVPGAEVFEFAGPHNSVVTEADGWRPPFLAAVASVGRRLDRGVACGDGT